MDLLKTHDSSVFILSYPNTSVWSSQKPMILLCTFLSSHLACILKATQQSKMAARASAIMSELQAQRRKGEKDFLLVVFFLYKQPSHNSFTLSFTSYFIELSHKTTPAREARKCSVLVEFIAVSNKVDILLPVKKGRIDTVIASFLMARTTSKYYCIIG